MLYNKIDKRFLFATVIWMAVVFFFSAQTADQSSRLSQGLSGEILEFLNNVGLSIGDDYQGQNNGNELNGIIREAAHASIYFILAILVNYTVKLIKMNYVVSFLICIFYAVSDEIHQLFVPGRTFQLFDLSMDFTGTIAGLLVFSILQKIRTLQKTKQ
jgi:VanZ family protein